MLLQVMPAQNAQQDDFDHLATLTETIKTEELLTLPANEVLWRLYHEEEVTVYDPQDVEFKCTCSRERCADALKTLPDEEVDSVPRKVRPDNRHCDREWYTHGHIDAVQPVGTRSRQRRNAQRYKLTVGTKTVDRPLNRLRVQVVYQATLYLLALSGASCR